MLHDEQILTFSQAAKALPPVNGRRPHTSTVWRWARKGCLGIRLEVRRLGGRFVTSKEALERFAKALADVDPPAVKTPPPPTPGALTKPRQRDVDSAEKRLEAAGF